MKEETITELREYGRIIKDGIINAIPIYSDYKACKVAMNYMSNYKPVCGMMFAVNLALKIGSLGRILMGDPDINSSGYGYFHATGFTTVFNSKEYVDDIIDERYLKKPNSNSIAKSLLE